MRLFYRNKCRARCIRPDSHLTPQLAWHGCGLDRHCSSNCRADGWFEQSCGWLEDMPATPFYRPAVEGLLTEVSKDQRERARVLSHHQRLALKQIGLDRPLDGVGATNLRSVVKAGWVVTTYKGVRSLTLTARRQELHDTLEALGWFPPGKDDVPPYGFSR